MNKKLLISHADCKDGFCAAWVVRRHFMSIGQDLDIYFAHHGTEPPWEMVDGRDILVVDFSYKRPVMNRLLKRAASLVVLDHHKTAQEDLKDFPGAVFDMNKSGAGLAWDYFNPDQKRPWIVDYVEDRDLWKHSLPSSKAVSAYLSTLPFDYTEWDAASANGPRSVNPEGWSTIIAMGTGAMANNKAYVEQVRNQAMRFDFEGYNIPLVNTSFPHISELVGDLAKGESFAMGWFQNAEGKFKYSLRSVGDMDVSELAKRYGGGGHKNAAGFVLDYPLHMDAESKGRWVFLGIAVLVVILMVIRLAS